MSGDTALALAKRYVKKTLQGQGALKGQDGFSPTIKENPNNTDNDYRLDITDKNGTITTPNLKGADGGGSDYKQLKNKPSIGGVEIDGNKTLDDLGIQPKGEYLTEETDPTVPQWAKENTKPIYTASEVGADSVGSADMALSDAKEYTDNKIADLINGAPETMDTLKEIADALEAEQSTVEVLQEAIGTKLNKDGDSKDNTVTFVQSETRENIDSGDKHSVLFGKIRKWLFDLKEVAFSGSYTDLSNKPSAEDVGALPKDGNATSATKATNDGDGNNITETYATKVQVADINNKLAINFSHNIPRLIPKDITSYYTDGTLWQRLNGTNGFSLYEDIYVGDYFKMSRPISAYNQDQTQQATGSDYVTIAGIGTLYGNGDSKIVDYEHLVMIPGKGFGGTQHFGRSRMNPTNTTVGAYTGSEMYTTTIGEVTTEGSTDTTATINQQLYAEFGSHLKTTRESLSNSINESGYNRYGTNSGCSNNYGWYDCQAVLMSEIEVYGSTVWSSSGYDTGTAKVQLPLFANNKSALNNRSCFYYLKGVASTESFCCCNYDGGAAFAGAGYTSIGVRPRFVIA